MKHPFAVLVFALIPFAPAVADHRMVQLSPDTYMIVRDSKAGVFASITKLKGEVIAEANSFATSKGKVAIPISAKETHAIPFVIGRWPAYEYQFRLADPNDPTAKSTVLGFPARDGTALAVNTATHEQATDARRNQGKAEEAPKNQATESSTGTMNFDQCFKKCTELTSRSAEQCFDACNK